MRKKVAIIMGSQSDLPVMKEAIECLKEFKISHEVFIVSAHRTPHYMFQFAKKAHSQGFKIIIAGAGGAAHLPGMVASLTPLPVIGVPILVGSLKGLDALLSIAQMPKGVPVATVAVNNSYNAALLATRILGISSQHTQKKLLEFSKKQKEKVLKSGKKIQVPL